MFGGTRIIKRNYPPILHGFPGASGYFIQRQNWLFFWMYEDCHLSPITLDEARKNEYIFKPFKNKIVETYKELKVRVIKQFYNNGEFRGFFVQQRSTFFPWLWENCHAIRYENADDAKNSVVYWHNRSKEIVTETAEAKKRCRVVDEVVYN